MNQPTLNTQRGQLHKATHNLHACPDVCCQTIHQSYPQTPAAWAALPQVRIAKIVSWILSHTLTLERAAVANHIPTAFPVLAAGKCRQGCQSKRLTWATNKPLSICCSMCLILDCLSKSPLAPNAGLQLRWLKRAHMQWYIRFPFMAAHQFL